MRKILMVLTVTVLCSLSACKLADKLFGAKPATPPGKSPAAQTVKGLVESGAIDPTTGELVMGGLLLAQNAYLLIRRARAKRSTSPTA